MENRIRIRKAEIALQILGLSALFYLLLTNYSTFQPEIG